MDEKVVIAIIGFSGVVVGAVIQIGGTLLKHGLEQRAKEKTDNKRKELLKTMLKDERFKWRKLDTLMHVVGMDEDGTKRLLLELEARGSEDGQELWGLISRNPFLDRQ